MDDLHCIDSWSNDKDDDDDPNRVSSLLLHEIQTVARMMGLPEVETLEPEIETDLDLEIETLEPKMRAIELAMDDPKVNLLEEHENGKEIAPKDEKLDICENQNSKQTNPMIEKQPSSSSSSSIINYNNHPTSLPSPSTSNNYEPEQRTDLYPAFNMAQFTNELTYHAAMFRPVMNIESDQTVDEESKKRKRNMKTSNNDPEMSMETKKRRERISENIRVLQRLIPGGGEMDIASLIDETANYLRFLGKQVKAHQGMNYKIGSNYYFPPTFYFPQ